MFELSQKIEDFFQPIKDLPCCRKHAGEHKSLSLGFGKKTFHHDDTLHNSYYGEWEIGTYSASWRIVKEDRIVCGSGDPVDSYKELNERIKTIDLGTFLRLELRSQFDVRVFLSNQTYIDFLGCYADQEEDIIHIFAPQNLFTGYSIAKGWYICRSDTPQT